MSMNNPIMKIYLLIVLVFLTSSCDQSLPTDSYPYWNKSSERGQILANSIAKNVLEKLKDKKMYLCQCGWALEGHDNIKSLHCGFFHYQDISIEEGRNLLMLITNLFLQEINANGRIRPYLEDYPFTSENLCVDIFLQNKDGSSKPPEKLHVVWIDKGDLRYSVGSIPPLYSPLTTVLRETYSEAMEKVDPASRCGL